jgi:hypothetical protein
MHEGSNPALRRKEGRKKERLEGRKEGRKTLHRNYPPKF